MVYLVLLTKSVLTSSKANTFFYGTTRCLEIDLLEYLKENQKAKSCSLEMLEFEPSLHGNSKISLILSLSFFILCFLSCKISCYETQTRIGYQYLHENLPETCKAIWSHVRFWKHVSECPHFQKVPKIMCQHTIEPCIAWKKTLKNFFGHKTDVKLIDWTPIY